jgi:hypothetical protein
MNKGAMLQQQFAVQVTTLPHCDDITRFDGTPVLYEKNEEKASSKNEKILQS